MPINFKNIAQRATVLSPVMQGRTKVDKEDGRYHIYDFDIVTNTNGEPYAICAINDDEFINGGYVLTKIFLDVMADAGDMDIEEVRAEFRRSGGLDVELKRTRTKNKRDITQVTIL